MHKRLKKYECFVPEDVLFINGIMVLCLLSLRFENFGGACGCFMFKATLQNHNILTWFAFLSNSLQEALSNHFSCCSEEK
jgi:hypothetical protein